MGGMQVGHEAVTGWPVIDLRVRPVLLLGWGVDEGRRCRRRVLRWGGRRCGWCSLHLWSSAAGRELSFIVLQRQNIETGPSAETVDKLPPRHGRRCRRLLQLKTSTPSQRSPSRGLTLLSLPEWAKRCSLRSVTMRKGALFTRPGRCHACAGWTKCCSL